MKTDFLSSSGKKKKKIINLTSRQIQLLDKKASRDFGIATLVLMENAGKAVCQEALRFLRLLKKSGVTDKYSYAVNIFCGKGNNGGDGFVAARYLVKKGVKARVFLLGKAAQLKQDAAVNFMKLKKIGAEVHEIPDLKSVEKFKKIFLDCSLLIDSIFGVGLKGILKEPFFSLIDFLNQSALPILAVDVPSGLDATSGKICGTAIKAGSTVTFTLPKTGFFKNQGPNYCGKIIVRKIGIPESLI